MSAGGLSCGAQRPNPHLRKVLESGLAVVPFFIERYCAFIVFPGTKEKKRACLISEACNGSILKKERLLNWERV